MSSSGNAQLLRRLTLLRKKDRKLRVFGAAAHDYQLNPPLTEAQIVDFESPHRTELPPDYRSFLLECGNGGAGPYYGLFPLGLFDGSGSGLEPWNVGGGFAGTLSEPFPHTARWNLPDERLNPPTEFANDDEYDKWIEGLDEEYWAPNLVDGAFPICHQGCAYRNLLVVSGPERGNVWLDARASEGGILPVEDGSGGRMTFSAWYEAWIDAGLDGRRFE